MEARGFVLISRPSQRRVRSSISGVAGQGSGRDSFSTTADGAVENSVFTVASDSVAVSLFESETRPWASTKSRSESLKFSQFFWAARRRIKENGAGSGRMKPDVASLLQLAHDA
jgi:hypothetical protein